jgi:hypothetical protein
MELFTAELLDRLAEPDVQRLLLTDTSVIPRWLLPRIAPRLCPSYLRKVYQDFSQEA